jgi:ABC-type bacteriocin/lantibiotic exporter with double-glycine peptidase domain
MPSGNNALVSSKPKLVWKSLPGVWALLRPQWMILAAGFGLMVANRAAGLVLPASSKYLLDDVILRKHVQILPALVLAVLTATAVEAATSYLLAQLISKSAQRLITDLRIKLQAHVGRLPLSFYDGNNTGVLRAKRILRQHI